VLWSADRQLLAEEKEFTRRYDAFAAKQRTMPWVRIDKEYAFDSPSGKVTLAQLFRDRSQLFVKHFMMGPGAKHQCVGCSLEVDHVEGILDHFENHDVSYVAVARAPIEEIEVVRKRMGWHIPGFRRTAMILTTTSAFPSDPKRLPPAGLSTIFSPRPHQLSQWKTCPATASFI
jgi:predicted dithiol-disulfide oxidoreductase (DUF899 family)